MTKVISNTMFEVLKIPSLDLRFFPTGNDSTINEATSLNPAGTDMVDRNRKKGKFKF